MTDLVLHPELTWYLARSTGIVAWALLTISVLIGLVQSTRTYSRRPGPAWLRSFHGYAGGLALVFTGVHMVGLLLDGVVDFGWVDLLVPFASEWRPGAVAWGIVAFYLTVAIQLTAVLRTKLPRGAWLKVHRAAALTYVLSTAHLLTAGSDVTNPLLMAVVLVSIVASGSLLLTRVVLSLTTTSRTQPIGAAPALELSRE